MLIYDNSLSPNKTIDSKLLVLIEFAVVWGVLDPEVLAPSGPSFNSNPPYSFSQAERNG